MFAIFPGLDVKSTSARQLSSPIDSPITTGSQLWSMDTLLHTSSTLISWIRTRRQSFKEHHRSASLIRTHHNQAVVVVLLYTLCVCVISLVLTPTRAANPTIGFLSDSNTDEYRAEDNRAAGTPYGATTLNWAELLVKKRGLDAGPWGTWGEPRRSGYAYNWSRSGATADSMITGGQHTGLAAQIAAGQVEYAIIYIGTNDFNTWNGTYNDVYSGNLNGAQLQAKIDTIVARITTAVNTLQAAGHPKIVLANFADPGQSSTFMTTFPSATGRARVTNTILSINAQLDTLVAAKGIVLADLYHFGSSWLSRSDANGNLLIGGQAINTLVKGDEPHHLQLNDSVGHMGTVASGLLANFFINSLSQGYGMPITPFSDTEILTNSGIVVPTPTPTPSLTYTPSPTQTPSPTSAPNAAPQINFHTNRIIILTWNRVTWATGYEIQISMDINFPPAVTFTRFLPAESLAYTTEPLENGRHYWRVKALGSTSNLSKWSNVDSFVISAP